MRAVIQPLPPLCFWRFTILVIVCHHAHHRAAELFFVLRGTVIFHLDEQEISADGGDFIVVPSETLHDLENPGPQRLYLLTVLSRDEGFAELLEHGIPTPLDA